MRKNQFKYIVLLCIVLIGNIFPASAKENDAKEEKVDIAGMIMGHLMDSYEWHIASDGDKHYSIPLPIIVYSETNGLNVFMSSRFHHGHEAYNGFYIATEGPYKDKIVEKNAAGEEVRPWDLSITKNTLGLMMSCVILLVLVLSTARWYKKNCKDGVHVAPKGFVGFMEMFIMSIVDDVIKPCVGKNYKKFTPYLLTAFFFIFINNLMGLIPIFPGGANVTGNIAVTLVLALFTFFIVNIFGTKEYWKEIFNPPVPTWLKLPIPIMPAIEVIGMFTKPFALMIRLFANILAGHSVILGLMSLIFVTASLGVVLFGSMTFVSVVMTMFMDLVEVLVAYIQAYVFTMLSAVFIGLAQAEPHSVEKH
ncbi:F0F1 ATP synthase subunit A [Dysgonomonas sp. Marseille-P4361]|uniref:F0F1 ATP synthase subunit A n=1 Tax=Dysgonomonas sp. Marseille-P4361 TaxID=2161820 RepID=UPI000D5609D7|nr:F0F1 ATP synthase subunit A [Dysgonomonas sp. Marseille-P4361]